MRLVIGLILAAGLLLSSVDVFAGDEEGSDGKCRPAVKRIMRKVREIFKEKDADGDGVITLREWGPRVRIFKAIDRNNDGKIMPRELAAFLLKQVKEREEKSQ